MRGREAAVSAVSEPEKKLDSAISRPIAPMVMAVSVVMVGSLRIVVGMTGGGTTLLAEGLIENAAKRLRRDVPG